MPFVQIPSDVDQAFRTALIELAPNETIRRRVREALANGPHPNGRGHATEYFADRLEEVIGKAAAFADWLDAYMMKRGRPDLIRWLDATGYGNDYRVIKTFAAWAELQVYPMAPQKPETLPQ